MPEAIAWFRLLLPIASPWAEWLLGRFFYCIFFQIDIFLYFCLCFEPPSVVLSRTYWQKAFSGRFGFDVLELRNFKLSVKNKAAGTPHLMYIYFCYIFIWRGVFSVARFDWQGNAKASTRGTGDRTGSTSFFLIFMVREPTALVIEIQLQTCSK